MGFVMLFMGSFIFRALKMEASRLSLIGSAVAYLFSCDPRVACVDTRFLTHCCVRLTRWQEPPAVKWMQENKMNAFCGVWMLSLMSSQLMATGAFEVYYNGNVVYSKLDTGSIPHVQDLARSLQLFGVMPSNSAL